MLGLETIQPKLAIAKLSCSKALKLNSKALPELVISSRVNVQGACYDCASLILNVFKNGSASIEEFDSNMEYHAVKPVYSGDVNLSGAKVLYLLKSPKHR